MEIISIILLAAQFIFIIIAGLYFYVSLKNQNSSKSYININSKNEIEKLNKLRKIHLTTPLSEKNRPSELNEIIGQESGIKALKAALCGPNPQHVIIYGPPGVGKTAAARIILDEAKNSLLSPFKKEAKFVEMDATVLQFDERNIADPLMGSVHDPIYQGAGAFGTAGVPQPKPGAVTKAHGGILFIDEIGELHSMQMNKLLKVLEDRKVFLTSSYYSPDNKNIPGYIHDIFKNGLPADFRLVGATTRLPEEIPAALRSRCTEVFFRSLKKDEVAEIASNTIEKSGFKYDKCVSELISGFSMNGRDTVNIVQTAVSLAMLEKRKELLLKDIEDVIDYGRYSPIPSTTLKKNLQTGVVNGLAVTGAGQGMIIRIEADVKKADISGNGNLIITGIADIEEIKKSNGTIKRKSTAMGSIENAITILEKLTGINTSDYIIHINFPGGIPIDGPSAGTAIFCCLYSAIFNKTVSSDIALTGEISIKGNVLPVGGVSDKIEAGISSGANKIIIPKDNWQESYNKFDNKVVYVESINEVIKIVFGINEDNILLKDKIMTA